MINLDLHHNRLLVKISPYDEALVERLKALGGGHYDKATRAWKFPITRLEALVAEFPSHWKEPRLAKYVELLRDSEALRAADDAPQPVGVKRPLFKFQRIATAFLARHKRALLRSVGVGVGKSAVGIAWARAYLEYQDRRGVLVVTKNAGKRPYVDEIHRAIPTARVAVVTGRDGDFPTAQHADFVVMNYDILDDRKEQILARRFAALVLSESHRIKGGRSTERGRAALALTRDIPCVLLETASFTPNRNAEAFPQLCCLGIYDEQKDWYPWHMHFCDGHQIKINRFGAKRWDFSGSTHSDELYRVIKPFTYTIIRDEVLPQLPPVTFTPVLVDSTTSKEYNRASKDFLAWVDETKGADAAARVTVMREILDKKTGQLIKKIPKPMAIAKLNGLLEIAARGNVAAAEEYIETFLDAGRKVIVFSSYKAPLLALLDRFPAISVLITGDQSDKQKKAAIDAIQNSSAVGLGLCTTEAGGESITLTAADAVLFLSLPWSPKTWEQAYGRADRYGQKRPVNVIVLIGRNTVQVEQVETLYEKELEISKVTTGSDRSPSSETLRRILCDVTGADAERRLF